MLVMMMIMVIVMVIIIMMMMMMVMKILRMKMPDKRTYVGLTLLQWVLRIVTKIENCDRAEFEFCPKSPSPPF